MAPSRSVVVLCSSVLTTSSCFVTTLAARPEPRDSTRITAAANVTLVPHSFYFGPGLAATELAVTVDDLPAHGALPPGTTRTAIAARMTFTHESQISSASCSTHPGFG